MIAFGIFAVRMKVLVIAPRFPYPLEKGDKLRLYQQLRHLSDKYEIHLFAITHHRVTPADQQPLLSCCTGIHIHQISRWRTAWNLFTGFLRGLPLSVAYFTDNDAIGAAQRFREEVQPDLLYGQLIRVGEYLKRMNGPKVLDLMDAFSVIMEQRIQRTSFWQRPFLRIEAKRLAQYEQSVPLWTNLQTFISERDRFLIDPVQSWQAHIIPNGIDTTYFQARSNSEEPPADLTYIGNLGYYPNRVAAIFLVKKIMPLIWKTRPTTTLLIAGARPTKDVVALAEPRVRIIPWLDDIRDGYRKGSVFIAPIHLGAGLQNKILEAMAMELAVITTSHVNQAISAQPGHEILIADTAEEFASHALELLSFPERGNELVTSALTFVRSNFSWQTSVKHLDEDVFQSPQFLDDAT
ncbi:MAG: glycosyltransferase [Saprospiraceae bacterium]|nr:glycosyltransferase [Saprospiraceae bacterium]